MRRTLFGKSSERERLAPPRASVREALLFDIRDHEASTDLTLAERRADSWTFAPWLLFERSSGLFFGWLRALAFVVLGSISVALLSGFEITILVFFEGVRW